MEKKQTKKRFEIIYWLLLVPGAIYTTVFISLLPWIIQLTSAPKDKIFSGINRWSTDYFYYLSFVQQGVRGQLFERFLNIAADHPSGLIHLIYTIPGILMRYIPGFDSIMIYHGTRAILGIIFASIIFVFIYRLTKSKIISLLGFLYIFFVGGISQVSSLLPPVIFRPLPNIQEHNITARPTGPPHYNFSFILFQITILFFLQSKTTSKKKIIIMGALLSLLTIANPFNFLTITATFSLYTILIFLIAFFKRNFNTVKKELPIIFFSFLIALPWAIYYKVLLSNKIWGLVSNGPDYFIPGVAIPIKELIYAIGPTLPLGILGIFVYIFFHKKFYLSKKAFTILTCWIIAQFSLYFLGNQLKIDPIRLFNGLYYIPLGIFSALLTYSIARLIHAKIRKVPVFLSAIIIFIIPFLITLPTYYKSYQDLLYTFTDFKNYPPVVYPRKTQVEAFKFLEQNTPFPSRVLAMYEASVLMTGMSGNSAPPDGIPERYAFFVNGMSDSVALEFLNKWNYDYIFFGAQEKWSRGNMDKYPFLKKIFENEEISIYKVLR